MIEKQEKIAVSKEQPTRAEWEAPELRRLEAGKAETGGGFGADGAFS